MQMQRHSYSSPLKGVTSRGQFTSSLKLDLAGWRGFQKDLPEAGSHLTLVTLAISPVLTRSQFLVRSSQLPDGGIEANLFWFSIHGICCL